MLKRILPVVAYAAAHIDDDVSLASLARQAGLSPFHLQRVFLATAGETPKQFTLRLRLDRAAAMLLSTGERVLDIALECGFQSNEVFARAFRKRFGIAPSMYRARGFALSSDTRQAATHAGVVASVGPCIGLFQIHEQRRPQEYDVTYTIAKQEIAPQLVLVVRRKIKPSDLAATLASVLGQVVQFAQKNGIGLAGQPFTRYLEWGPGIWTVEAGLPVTSHAGVTASDSEVRADTLPGGRVAITTHAGSYEKLSEAHAAVQQWIEAEKLASPGGPWEVYTTDPADYPDPKDWKTEVIWPVRDSSWRASAQ